MEPPADHPSIEALVLPHRGQMSTAEASDRERDHLHAVCPECARIWQRFVELRRQEGERLDGAAAERARLQSRAMQARLAGDRRIAEREVERLLNLDREERRATVERALKRYRTPAFVERVIEEARLYLRRNHREALALLELAELQVRKIPAHIYGAALVGRLSLRVRAHQANTLRVAGDLRAAEARFAEIAEELSSASTDDDSLLGELASLEASLRYDQRRLRQAEELLEKAEALFRRTGDTTGLVKVMVKRGLILYTGGRPERAIPLYEAALAAVDPVAEPRLALTPRHNLVLSLMLHRRCRSRPGSTRASSRSIPSRR